MLFEMALSLPLETGQPPACGRKYTRKFYYPIRLCLITGLSYLRSGHDSEVAGHVGRTALF